MAQDLDSNHLVSMRLMALLCRGYGLRSGVPGRASEEKRGDGTADPPAISYENLSIERCATGGVVNRRNQGVRT